MIKLKILHQSLLADTTIGLGLRDKPPIPSFQHSIHYFEGRFTLLKERLLNEKIHPSRSPPPFF